MEGELDPVDRKILKILVQDGRIPFSYIAKETKLSDVAVKKRVDKLISKGIIKRISAIVDKKRVGFKYTYFALLRVDVSDIQRVMRRLQELPHILEIHQLVGDYPILIKGVGEDIEEVRRFLDELGKIDGVADVKTYISLEEYEKPFVIPLKIGQRVLG